MTSASKPPKLKNRGSLGDVSVLYIDKRWKGKRLYIYIHLNDSVDRQLRVRKTQSWQAREVRARHQEVTSRCAWKSIIKLLNGKLIPFFAIFKIYIIAQNK